MKFISKLVLAIIGICLLPTLIIPLIGDIVKVTWFSSPLWVRAGIVLLAVIVMMVVAVAIFRFVQWLFAPRRPARRRYYR